MIKAFKKISFEHLVTPLIILVGILLFATGSKKNNNIPSANFSPVNRVSNKYPPKGIDIPANNHYIYKK